MTNETEYQRGYREGAEKMREGAAQECFRQMREGEPNSDFCYNMKQQRVAAHCGHSIRKLPITPPQPEAKAEDDEREMREAFESYMVDYGFGKLLNRYEDGYDEACVQQRWRGWQAAWKEKSK